MNTNSRLVLTVIITLGATTNSYSFESGCFLFPTDWSIIDQFKKEAKRMESFGYNNIKVTGSTLHGEYNGKEYEYKITRVAI